MMMLELARSAQFHLIVPLVSYPMLQARSFASLANMDTICMKPIAPAILTAIPTITKTNGIIVVMRARQLVATVLAILIPRAPTADLLNTF